MSAATKHTDKLQRWFGTRRFLIPLGLVLAVSGCRSFYDQTTPPPAAVGVPGAVNIPTVDGITPIATPPPPPAPGAVPPPPSAPPNPPLFGFFDSVGMGRAADARLTLSPQSIVAPVEVKWY